VKSQKSIVILLLLGTLHFPFSSQLTAAGPGKNAINQRGGQASAHMSPKGSANSNAQWSADPTRGWIRANERHELRKTSAPKQSNTDKGKSKAKAKAGN